MLSRLLGENPCDVDRIFRKIKQFGFTARQAGGVCGVEMALMDLAGNIDFIMVNGRGSTKVLKLNSLLPHAFGQKNLERTKKSHH